MTTRELPILMAGEMVRAILEDRKTNTRRPTPGEMMRRQEDPYPWYIRRPDMVWDSFKDLTTLIKARSPYLVGHLLYVRETFCWAAMEGHDRRPDGGRFWYRATDSGQCEGTVVVTPAPINPQDMDRTHHALYPVEGEGAVIVTGNV